MVILVVLLVSVLFLMCLLKICNLLLGVSCLQDESLYRVDSYCSRLAQSFSLGGDGRGEKGEKGREKRKRGRRKGRRKIRLLSSRLLRTKLRTCTTYNGSPLKKKKITSPAQISEVGKLISLIEGRSFKIKLYGYKRSLTRPSLQPTYRIDQPTQKYLLNIYIYVYNMPVVP